jgi:hypothetical protein
MSRWCESLATQDWTTSLKGIGTVIAAKGPVETNKEKQQLLAQGELDQVEKITDLKKQQA